MSSAPSKVLLNAVVILMSDTEIFQIEEVTPEFATALEKGHAATVIQIGRPTIFSGQMRRIGAEVHEVRRIDDIPRLVLNRAKKEWGGE